MLPPAQPVEQIQAKPVTQIQVKKYQPVKLNVNMSQKQKLNVEPVNLFPNSDKGDKGDDLDMAFKNLNAMLEKTQIETSVPEPM